LLPKRTDVIFWQIFVQNETTRAEIEALVKTNDVAALKSKLCRRMEFGTAGTSDSYLLDF